MQWISVPGCILEASPTNNQFDEFCGNGGDGDTVSPVTALSKLKIEFK